MVRFAAAVTWTLSTPTNFNQIFITVLQRYYDGGNLITVRLPFFSFLLRVMCQFIHSLDLLIVITAQLHSHTHTYTHNTSGNSIEYYNRL